MKAKTPDKLADRSEKYKIAIDAGILEWKERMLKAEARSAKLLEALERIAKPKFVDRTPELTAQNAIKAYKGEGE